jgi:hypothetical protein
MEFIVSIGASIFVFLVVIWFGSSIWQAFSVFLMGIGALVGGLLFGWLSQPLLVGLIGICMALHHVANWAGLLLIIAVPLAFFGNWFHWDVAGGAMLWSAALFAITLATSVSSGLGIGAAQRAQHRANV